MIPTASMNKPALHISLVELGVVASFVESNLHSNSQELVKSL